MKTKIIVGTVLLLTLGSAVGGMIFPSDLPGKGVTGRSDPSPDSHSVTPEMIAKWKATAATADYSPPMLPI